MIGEYINTHTKTLFKCELDGYEWMAFPSDICNGHGCPRCKTNNARKRYMWTNEIFLEKLSKVRDVDMLYSQNRITDEYYNNFVKKFK